MRHVIKIEHYRCDEWDGCTYILAPEGMSDDEISEAKNKAMDNYLAAIAEFERLEQPPKFLHLDDCPEEMTIGEAKKAIKERNELQKEWDKKRSLATADFAYWLGKLGFGYLGEAEEDEIPIYVANWGHRHGQQLNYKTTEIQKWSLCTE